MNEYLKKKSIQLLTKQVNNLNDEINSLKEDYCHDCPLDKSNDCGLCQIDTEINNYKQIIKYKMRDKAFYENDQEQFIHFNVNKETETINYILGEMLKEGSREEALSLCHERLHIVEQIASMYPEEEYLRLIDIWKDIIKQISIMLGDYNDEPDFMS